MVETKERLLGPYRLVREAGRGGMATVYEAVDTREERTVAVKVLSLASEQRSEERQKQLARLRREALAISRLHHPNIVALYDFVIDEDTPDSPIETAYIVMEYVAGETLRQRLRRTGTIPPKEAVAALEQIASALDAVHTAGIVHRDLKPSNVMLLPDGTAKLMDFGVARLEDDTKVTRTGMVVGSPAYMSPEQATGQPVTPVSDVWSLAALFFEMLAGYPAFRGENIPVVLYQVAFGEPASLPDTTSETQPIFDRFSLVFEQAFARQPSERFATAGAMAAAFRAALDAREVPVVVPRPAAPPVQEAPSAPDTSESATVFATALKRPSSVLLLPAALGILLLGVFWPRAKGAEAPPAPSVSAAAATPAAVVPAPKPATLNPTVTDSRSIVALNRKSPSASTPTGKATPKPITPPKKTGTAKSPTSKPPVSKAAVRTAAKPPPRSRPAVKSSWNKKPRGKAKGVVKKRGRGNSRSNRPRSTPPFSPKTVLIPGRR
jgi:serine/threonine-protein kinase